MTYRHESYWVDSVEGRRYPAASGVVSVDVVVVGGGIVGLTAGLLLKRAGKKVAIIEANKIAHGVSGYTTAKVSAGHGLIYSQITKTLGAEAARIYGESNQAAIGRISSLIDELGVDCDFEPTDNYVYSESPDQVDSLKQEAEAARNAGLPATFTTESTLPFPVAGAVKWTEQAQFHPRKYFVALAEAIDGDGSFVFEHTAATSLKEDSPCVVGTPDATISADQVILATHYPTFDRGLFFAKVAPYRAYVVTAKIDSDKAPHGMWITSTSPTRSVRTTPYEDGRLLIITGEGHKVGQEAEPEKRYAALEEWTRSRFDIRSLEYRWSTQDNQSVDHVPYVGRLTRSSENVFTATGFAGWGMTNGTMSAMLLSDLVQGIDNPWMGLYDSNRFNPAAAAKEFVKENVNVAYRFFSDRLRGLSRSVDDIPRGEGDVVTVGPKSVAVYKDDNGDVRALSARCTHLGCIVQWNGAEKSWDCPCHGSRFTTSGEILQGPATRRLDDIDLTDQE
ncbi:MAG: FAD-dependent oxidoreductase [Actinomycetota bacterium]|nr:FAD-dependent oxidoreductase [Actinomycetota bacterium]